MDEQILKYCHPFVCVDEGVNEFFQREFIDYEKQLFAVSYCFLLKEDPKTIVAAFALSSDSINRKAIDKTEDKKADKKIRKNIPHSKEFKNRFPAVLIGQLGVAKSFSKKETDGKSTISEEILDFIKKWVIDSDVKIASRFLIADAINEPSVLKYYENNNFKYLFSNEDFEKVSLNLRKDVSLKTRLMVFDLISVKE